MIYREHGREQKDARMACGARLRSWLIPSAPSHWGGAQSQGFASCSGLTGRFRGIAGPKGPQAVEPKKGFRGDQSVLVREQNACLVGTSQPGGERG